MRGQEHSSWGFTLIEVIITLMIAAILGVVMYEYLGSSLVRSSEPFVRLTKSFSLRQVVENVSADYKQNYIQNLPGLKTKLGVEGSQQTNGYGVYTVVYNRYITFDAGNAETTATAEKVLKVTIKNDQNETITMLFISA